MPAIPALVDPQMLVWARASANLTPLAAARKMRLPADRVEQWERGEVAPSIAQLRKAAAVYKRPLAVFFLAKPPEGFNTLRDFRRTALSTSGAWSAALHAEYRRAHSQRDVLLELAELDDEGVPLDWRIAIPGNDEQTATKARKLLNSVAALPFPSPGADEYKHLNYWTNALEEAGVLVMSTEGGDVPVEEMRAFSLYFDDVPVVMLNGADATRGRLFSMLHEYVHLLLHTEGLCDTTTDTKAVTPDRQLEARCNAVAAAILMPSAAMVQSKLVSAHKDGDAWSLADLVEAAKPFGVSVEAFMRRLVTLGRVPMTTYEDFRNERTSKPEAKSKTSGGNFYSTKARDLGKGYVRRVSAAHRRASIDSTTAATYLDIKIDQLDRLTNAAQVGS